MTIIGNNLPHVPEWFNEGLCGQTDPDAFFPEMGSTPHAAKAVCRRCPVLTKCRTYALQETGLSGVWGGMSERERRRWRTAQEQQTININDAHEHDNTAA